MPKLNPAVTLPTSSRDALEIFDERYNAAQLLQEPSTWVDELGESHATPALETKYPMSYLAIKYEEARTAAGHFQRIGEKDVELTVAEYKAGVEIELMKLMTNTFSAKRWADAPASFVQGEQVFKLQLIAGALEANTELCGWDELTLFHDSHLCNPKDADSDTFDNLQAGAKNVANVDDLEGEITAMAEVKDINGDPLGVMPTHVGVPRQKFQKLKNLLKQDFIPSAAGTATMRNPYNDGSLTVVRLDQLTDVNDWYLFDLPLIMKGVPPWVIAKLQLAMQGFDDLGLRRYSPENSDHARQEGVVGVSSHIHYGFKFLHPHPIRKVTGS